MSPCASDRLERWVAWLEASPPDVEGTGGDGDLMLALWERGYEPPQRPWDPLWASTWGQEAARTPHDHLCPLCRRKVPCQELCILYGARDRNPRGPARPCSECERRYGFETVMNRNRHATGVGCRAAGCSEPATHGRHPGHDDLLDRRWDGKAVACAAHALPDEAPME